MEVRGDLTRTTLAVLFVTGLIGACFWILRPFVPAIIWATTLVVATWPLMERVQHRLWNRRGFAVAVMTLALLLVFIVPFWLAITTITENFERILGWATAMQNFKLPPPPEWLGAVPLFGDKAAEFCRHRRNGWVPFRCSATRPRSSGTALQPAASSRWWRGRHPMQATQPPGSSQRWADWASCSYNFCSRS
jgi:hypothetical protein